MSKDYGKDDKVTGLPAAFRVIDAKFYLEAN